MCYPFRFDDIHQNSSLQTSAELSRSVVVVVVIRYPKQSRHTEPHTHTFRWPEKFSSFFSRKHSETKGRGRRTFQHISLLHLKLVLLPRLPFTDQNLKNFYYFFLFRKVPPFPWLSTLFLHLGNRFDFLSFTAYYCCCCSGDFDFRDTSVSVSS